MGIKWKDEHKTYLQNNEPFSIDECVLTMIATCKADLSDILSVPIIPSPPERKKETKAFVMMILSTQSDDINEKDSLFETFSCPMTFSTCSYNWCVTGENKLVSCTYLFTIYKNLRIFYSLFLKNKLFL